MNRSRNAASFFLPVGLFIGTTLTLMAHVAPAKANRPLMRPPSVLSAMKLTMPVSLEKITEMKFLAIDLEDEGMRKTVLRQAEVYVSLRRGRMSSNDVKSWFEHCESGLGRLEANPFCGYELERKNQAIKAQSSSASASESKRSLAADLREGKFESAAKQSFGIVIGAVRQLEISGQLESIAEKVAGMKECVPANIPSALGYKLEEQFPDSAVIDLVKKLYAKSAACGRDQASAQASFRLGLIHIWQNRCSEVPALMAQVEANPEGAMYRARAKYWQYHCAGVSGQGPARIAAKAALVHDHPMSFQTLAVSGEDDSALSQIINDEAPTASLRSVVRADLNSRLRAAEALIRIDSGPLAAEIIEKSMRDFMSVEPELRLYIAVLLNRTGFALPKFKLLSDLFQDAPHMVSTATLKLYFPLWYYDLVKAKQSQVDPLLILSLIRQESAFASEARSIAGARGLMQVMPATARTVSSVRTKKLLEPSTNITIGTKYFLKRLAEFDGDVELTLAAYNAGHMRVDQWRKRYPTENKMLFLDFIPFRETREYVSSILRNYYWYVKLYTPEKGAQANAPVAGGRISTPGIKAIAIMHANAGAAASLKTASVKTKLLTVTKDEDVSKEPIVD